jgi:hypothetical protein
MKGKGSGAGVPDRDYDDEEENKLQRQGDEQVDDDESGDEGGNWDTGNQAPGVHDDDMMPPDMPDENDQAGMHHWHKQMADHHRKMAEMCGGGRQNMDEGMDDGQEMAEMGGSPVSAETARPKQTTVTHKYAERALAAMRAERAAFEAFHEERLGEERRAAIKARLDSLVAQRKVTPRERDAGLDQQLYLADATQLYRFSEGGMTVERTELENMLAVLEARPILYGERIKSGVQNFSEDATADNDTEIAKVEAVFHSFAERGNLPRGANLKTFVEGFKVARKHDPTLTADEFFRS